jgi:hypothetical protein
MRNLKISKKLKRKVSLLPFDQKKLAGGWKKRGTHCCAGVPYNGADGEPCS